MADVKHGPVRVALEQTLASDPILKAGKHAALVALCRVTADQVDAAGAEVSSRLIASYLSALKDVDKALAGRPVAMPKSDAKTAEKPATSTALGKLQGLKGGKSA